MVSNRQILAMLDELIQLTTLDESSPQSFKVRAYERAWRAVENQVEEVARLTDSTVNDVWGVASFYTNFRFTPPAEHTVEVCWGPSCHVQGAPAVLKAILNHLKLTTEGEAAERGITFKYNTCLGACPQAPVMSIDHKLVGRVKAEEALKRVKRLHEEEVAGTAHREPRT